MSEQTYPKAYDANHLKSLIESNDSGPDCTTEMSERLITLAQQRGSRRNESALTGVTECVIATNWVGYCSDTLGHDGDTLNHYMIGCHKADVSRMKNADLFTDTHIIQQQWLLSGDGRRSEVEPYEDDFDGTDSGEVWIANSAQDYLCIIELDDELVYGDASMSDAM